MRFLTPDLVAQITPYFDSNWAPLPVVIVPGIPKRAIHPLKKATAKVLARISTNGNRSTEVRRYIKPSEYGRGPTISICTWSNLSVGSKNLLKTGLL